MEKTNRIYLRALEPEDYKTSINWRNDDVIWSMLGGRKYFVSSAYEQKWVNDAILNSQEIRLAICIKDTSQYIGNVYLTNIDLVNRSAMSHILIGEHDYWGQGYATEATKLLLEYAFEELGLNRVEAIVLKSNIGSIKMHKKCGYIEEGIKRNSIYKNGMFQDQVILSILKIEYAK